MNETTNHSQEIDKREETTPVKKEGNWWDGLVRIIQVCLNYNMQVYTTEKAPRL